MLPIDIYQFAVDLHGFLKLSSARREDYSNLQDLTEVASQCVLRHSSVRWLTLKFVLVRIIEQWTNLTEYFCKYIPKQKEFKSSIKDTKRYKNIIECLNDDLTLMFLPYVVILANEYESFLLPFQTEKPLIHMLFYGMSTLLTNLLQHFVRKKSLYVTVEGTEKIKPVEDLVKLNLEKNENLKSSKFIEIGTGAKTVLHKNIISDINVSNFRASCLKCYVAAASYLQTYFPFNNKLIKNAQ